MRRVYLLGLFVCLALVSQLRLVAAEPPGTRPPSLLTQAAVEQAQRALASGDAAAAVRVLEAELHRAEGHAAFLDLLADAYRRHLVDLDRAGRADLAATYRQRLARLTDAAHAAAPQVVQGNKPGDGHASDPLAAADQHFEQQRYADAARYYEQAAKHQINLNPLGRERWAYCKLFLVTERLNAASALDPKETSRLEQEVRTAQALAPRLQFAQTLLRALADRRPADAPSLPRSAPASEITASSNAVDLRRLGSSGGWQVMASPNFRLHYRETDVAEEILQAAERTRSAVSQKWLGRTLPPWSQPCDIYLHASASEYSQQTGAPSDSPGHSSIGAERTDASRIHSLRVDVRADHPFMLQAVLPHEVTHVVLAGQTGPLPLPRWADEGIAVLSETYERIGRHLTPLPQFYEEGRAFSALELLTLDDYPEPGRMGSFYGQSACLVQYLSELRGPTEVLEFLRSLGRKGPEQALQQHYGLTVAELDQRLRRFILVERTPSLASR
ncbi:MAG TPA: hypothetical protein PKD86_17960 [Gemmatales bacterium]|nr:hypothetical protein [Gemmatales bacterium]HMP61234.1 hypothetical protein [Gemmatales bacterium]